jgi:hypothetical protein
MSMSHKHIEIRKMQNKSGAYIRLNLVGYIRIDRMANKISKQCCKDQEPLLRIFVFPSLAKEQSVIFFFFFDYCYMDYNSMKL